MRFNRLWALVAQGALMAAFAHCALWGLQLAPVRLHESAIHKTHFCMQERLHICFSRLHWNISVANRNDLYNLVTCVRFSTAVHMSDASAWPMFPLLLVSGTVMCQISIWVAAIPSTWGGKLLCHTDACCICVGNGFLQQSICLRTSLATLLHLRRLWGKITWTILFSFLTSCFIATARLHYATSYRVCISTQYWQYWAWA